MMQDVYEMQALFFSDPAMFFITAFYNYLFWFALIGGIYAVVGFYKVAKVLIKRLGK